MFLADHPVFTSELPRTISEPSRRLRIELFKIGSAAQSNVAK